MKFNELYSIAKRLYRDYIKKYIPRILIALFLSILVAGSTSSIAWLLDPAIKKLFIDKDQSLIIINVGKVKKDKFISLITEKYSEHMD